MRIPGTFKEISEDPSRRALNASRVQRGAYRGGRIVQKEDWVPMGLRRQSNHVRSGGGYASKNKNLGTRSLQDRDMPIDKRVRDIKGDIDNDQAGPIAQTFLKFLEEGPAKIVR